MRFNPAVISVRYAKVNMVIIIIIIVSKLLGFEMEPRIWLHFDGKKDDNCGWNEMGKSLRIWCYEQI